MTRPALCPGLRSRAGRLASILALSLLPLGACGGAERVAEPFSAPTWELGESDLRIVSPDGEDAPLPFVEAVEEGPDGRIHSLHAREGSVRSWTADGRPDGRPGSGDGATLPDPQALGTFGDTLWVLDGQTYRIRLFGPDGSALGLLEPDLGTVPVDASPPGLPPRPVELLPDGTVLGLTPEVSEAVALGRQAPTAWVTMEAGGTLRDTVWVRSWRPRDVVALRRDGGTIYMSPPFDDGPLVDVASGGALVVVDRRVEDAVGTPTFAVTWIDMVGDTLAQAEVADEPRAVEATRVETAASELASLWRGFLTERGDSAGVEELEAAVRGALRVPPRWPPVVDLVVGVDGSAWLRRPSPETGPSEWWVVGPDGAHRARVEAPGDLRILWAGPDHVLGTVVDSAGASAIVRHPIRR